MEAHQIPESHRSCLGPKTPPTTPPTTPVTSVGCAQRHVRSLHHQAPNHRHIARKYGAQHARHGASHHQGLCRQGAERLVRYLIVLSGDRRMLFAGLWSLWVAGLPSTFPPTHWCSPETAPGPVRRAPGLETASWAFLKWNCSQKSSTLGASTGSWRGASPPQQALGISNPAIVPPQRVLLGAPEN